MSNKDKRYFIEKLISVDPLTKAETWKKIGISSDKFSSLENFIGEDCRVFDRIKKIEIKRNVDLSTWI